MTPEEHLRRMRHDEVWNLQAPPRTAARRAGRTAGAGSRRTQIWTTAVVAAAVVAVAGVAIAVAPARDGVPTGPGGAVAPSVAASASAEPSPDTASTPSPSVPSPAGETAHPVPAPPGASAEDVQPSAAAVSSRAAEPSAAPAAPTAAPAQDDHPALEFVAADRADVARGQRVVACLHARGVREVDLAAPDAQGIRYLEFGGARNDQQSISLGLQYADACIAAAGR